MKETDIVRHIDKLGQVVRMCASVTSGYLLCTTGTTATKQSFYRYYYENR